MLHKSILFCSLFISQVNYAQQQVVPVTDNAKPMTTNPTSKDPLNAVVRKLKNGLTVYLTVNKDEPRVQTLIAVKAGSKYDPADNTGLAHYLEHMMFKGTHKIGTKNWIEEKVLLDKISALFEKHKAEKDSTAKRAIYAEIDKLSYEASKYAIPNEYDKMISSLGAKGTNAYTSNDQTVYINDIPANEIEKWCMVESERFQTLVLRLFHTELEAVYEEYNISQDNDGRWAYANLVKALYPNHPYGTQTTIGEGEHLKNPSMVNIHSYFNKYYVPNNIAICISGDIDVEKTFATIEQYFGSWAPREITPFVQPKLPEIKAPLTIENFGPQDEFVYVGYRMPNASHKDILKLRLIDQILANGQAGLIDINLVQKQKVLQAYSSPSILLDHSVHILYGKPREKQSLEEVRDLLLAQVEKVKKGEFDEWIIQAAINDMKVEQLRSFERNNSRAGAFVEAFIHEQDWMDYITAIDQMKTLTKQDLVAFANKYYKNNYALSYKRKGDNKRGKVAKPAITPVVLNRDVTSDFTKKVIETKSAEVNPVFVDFNTAIKKSTSMPGTGESYYIKNTENELAKYTIIIDRGTDMNPAWGLAIEYFKYLGSDKYSAEDLKKEFYKLGLSIDASITRDNIFFTVSGLEENMLKGIEMMQYQIINCRPDTLAWKEMMAGIIKQRQNVKTDKATLLRAMSNFAKYGPTNPTTNIVPNELLETYSAKQLTAMIHLFASWPSRTFYYGPKEMRNAPTLGQVLDIEVKTKEMKEDAIRPKFKFMDNTGPNVFFYNYPGMVQAQIMMVHIGDEMNSKNFPYGSLFNDYFGSGLSSIVFQEIREQKALAYSAYAFYSTPERKWEKHILQAFVGTQADKMATAMAEMTKLLNTMPKVEQQFEGARKSALKQIASERITRENIFWRWEDYKRRGFQTDIRSDIFNELKGISMNVFESFFNKNIANKRFYYLVLGDKTKLKMEELTKLGEVKELDSKELLGY